MTNKPNIKNAPWKKYQNQFDAYNYCFKPTNSPEIDEILKAIVFAGSCYQDTDRWNDDYPGSSTSVAEWIQVAADEASNRIEHLKCRIEAPDVLTETLDNYKSDLDYIAALVPPHDDGTAKAVEVEISRLNDEIGKLKNEIHELYELIPHPAITSKKVKP